MAGDALAELGSLCENLPVLAPKKHLDLTAYYVPSDRIRLPKAEMLQNIREADFALIDLMGAPERFINEVGDALEECSGHRLIIGYGCRDKLRLGHFATGSMMQSKKDPGPQGRGGLATMNKMRNMATGVQKVLPIGIIRDMNNAFVLGDYWQSGQPQDIEQMMFLILREYFGWRELPKPEPPTLKMGIFLCDPFTRTVFDTVEGFRRQFPRTGSERPLIAFLMYGHRYPNDMYPLIQSVAEAFRGFADLLPIAFSNQTDKDLETLREYLTSEPVDLIVNFMPFRVGAGPMGGDAASGVKLLEELGVPLLEPFYISKQTREEWAENPKGASPGEFLISIMLPELDGGIETVPIAAMEPAKSLDGIGVEVTHAIPLEGAVERLAARAHRWIALQRKEDAEKKIALVSYNYPPGEEHFFSAAFLDTLASFEVLLRTLKEAGYDTEVRTAKQLKEAFLSRGLLNGSRYRTDGGSIHGLVLGNVFLGVQPYRGAAYHDKEATPPVEYIEFYRWIREEFRADALVHVGTHGTLEFLPGKENGLTPGDWAEQLLGNLPHGYYYYCGNASEGMTARRRSNAVLMTYAPPPFTESGLYGAYAELDALVTEYEEAKAAAPARAANLKGRIVTAAGELQLPTDLYRLEDELYRVRTAMIPNGLHVIGANGREETNALLTFLNGRYLSVGPMGDIRRNPDILPTGRNGVAFDPRFIPSKAAYERGAEIARASLERYYRSNGRWPKRTALVLWGLETTQTQGETVGQLMYYLGLRMVWKGTSFLSRIEVIPTEEMNRPRIDVTVTICGFFRDLFPALLADLNAALREIDELQESSRKSYYAEETRRRYERLCAAGMEATWAREIARSRFFGPAEGEYGTGLTDLVSSGQWETEEELGHLFTAELGYLYGETFQGERIPGAVTDAFSGVEMITQVRSTADYEITDLDHYYEFFGGLSKAVEVSGGQKPAAFFVDTTGSRVYADTPGEAVARGAATRLLNPKWIDGQLVHDFHGAQKIADRFENMVGLAAGLDAVQTETFTRMEEVYVADEEMRRRMTENNRYAYMSALEKLLEAERRGYWKATEEQKEEVRNVYLDLEGDIEDEL